MGQETTSPGKKAARPADEAAKTFECLIHLDESLTLRASCDRATLLRQPVFAT